MKKLHSKCQILIEAYKTGKLGQTVMPEDSNPGFLKDQAEERIAYFSLPMALNYQRDSYKLWQAALKTYNDSETRKVFDINFVSKMPKGELRKLLLRHRLALQPNKHINTWQTIAKTLVKEFGSWENLIEASQNDFLLLKELVQKKHKKGFPYLSGPKIFNYWSFILTAYGKVKLKNKEYIEIAPDTHVTKCSVELGLITKQEAEKISKELLSSKWREALKGSGVSPIEMHPPLWFWSRNGFIFKL